MHQLRIDRPTRHPRRPTTTTRQLQRQIVRVRRNRVERVAFVRGGGRAGEGEQFGGAGARDGVGEGAERRDGGVEDAGVVGQVVVVEAFEEGGGEGGRVLVGGAVGGVVPVVAAVAEPEEVPVEAVGGGVVGTERGAGVVWWWWWWLGGRGEVADDGGKEAGLVPDGEVPVDVVFDDEDGGEVGGEEAGDDLTSD